MAYINAAGTRAPLLTGWQPYQPIAYTNRSAAVPTKRPLISGAPNLGTVSYAPQQSAQDWLTEQVNRIIQSQKDAVEAQKAAYLADLQRQSDLEMQRGQALAAALQGLNIPGRIQGIYGDLSANEAGLAQAFSGAQRDQAIADSAQQTRMVSGTGQEGAVANNGAALGDVTYGLGGYIPAKSAGETGAAFASQAALEPGYAQRIAASKAGDVYSQGLEGLRQFTDQLLQIESQRPQIEQDLVKQYNDQVKANAPDPEAIHLSDGRIQWFDKNTGQALSNPFGPKKAGAKGSVKTVKLADGTYQAVGANGKPIGKPFGPAKAQTAGGTATLKTVNQGNKVSLVDPYTGKVIKTFPKASLAQASKTGKTYQSTITNADGSKDRITFDAQGNITNRVPLSGAKPGQGVKRVDEGGRLTGRTDGVTPTQARSYKASAYTIAQGWHKNNEASDDGEHFTWKQLLGFMVNSKGIPYDLAIRQLARFSGPARQALRSHINALTGQSTANPKTQPASYTTPQQVPQADVLPVSWTPTHVSDGLGWGTKSAVDLFPGPPGTPVGSPVAGTVVYFHPDGAQGGGSMLIRGDDGYEYWLGHIDNGVPAGTRLVRGSQVAVVSSRHPTPHVHIDRRRISYT